MHCTSGFVGVCAIAEAAISADGKDISEIMGYFFPFKIDGSEAFDTRGINNPTFGWVYWFIGFAVYRFTV